MFVASRNISGRTAYMPYGGARQEGPNGPNDVAEDLPQEELDAILVGDGEEGPGGQNQFGGM